MLPVIKAHADHWTKNRIFHILDAFFKKINRILEYYVAVDYAKYTTKWSITFFSRYLLFLKVRWNISVIYDSEADTLTLEAQDFVWPCSLLNLHTLLMREVGRICLWFVVYEFQRFTNHCIVHGSLNQSFSIELEMLKFTNLNKPINLRITVGMDCIIIEDQGTGLKKEVYITSSENGRFKDCLRKYILTLLS